MRVLIETPLMSAVSLGASTTSNPVDVTHLSNVAIHLIYTGTPTGTIDVEVSNDSTNWIVLGSPNTVALSGAAGGTLLQLTNIGYYHLRIKYTRTSSTGTLTALLGGKGF
jgi:hypothetical protein